MKFPKDSQSGVSPVIAVILMVAIAIILASVVSIWVFSFLGDANTDNVDKYIFDVSLSGSADTITISTMKGDPLDSAILTIRIDDQDVDLPDVTINVGMDMTASSPFDLVPGNSYHVTIVVQDEVQFSHDRIAAP